MNQNKESERGQSLVELGISLVFLLLLLGGAVDLGRAFFTFITLRDAAQEGVIYGSYAPTDIAGIKNRVRASATGAISTDGILPSNIQITTSPDSCPGSAITVSAKMDFEITMPLLGTFVGSQSFPIVATISDTILKNTACS